jgi:hypothetical protein
MRSGDKIDYMYDGKMYQTAIIRVLDGGGAVLVEHVDGSLVRLPVLECRIASSSWIGG